MLDLLLAAARPALAPAFALLGSPVTWLEIAGFGLSLWMVLANMRVNPIGWPLAIAASLVYALLFADSKLYGEAGLQLFFVVVAFWGWRQWLSGRRDNGQPLVVRRLPPRRAALATALTLAAWPALGLVLQHGTDSDVPFLDALPTVASVTGQVLLGRKYIENWVVWLFVNVVSVALFAYKGLWLTVVLYGLFALLSVAGWRAWQQLEGRAHG